MYIKIVTHHEIPEEKRRDGEEVVPESIIIECKRVDYKKIKIYDYSDFSTFIEKVDGVFTDGYEAVGRWNWKNAEESCEFILIKYPIKDNNHKLLVAIDCNIYVMSDNGKTIDSLSCN